MLIWTPDDRPLGIQLLGNDEGFTLRAFHSLEGEAFDFMNFNAVCPTLKITRKGKGAVLLHEPRKLKLLLKALVDNSRVLVTVRIRVGWDTDLVNASDICT